MSYPSIGQLVIGSGATLRTALECLDRTGMGICVVVDPGGKLFGVLTDGDARRALLRGLPLDSSIGSAVHRDCVFLPVGAASERIHASLSTGTRVIPLLDEDQRPVDYASFHHLHQIPIMEPSLAGNELAYLTECVQTNWISSRGRFVTRFQEMMAEQVGVPRSLAVSNGTVALHLALLGLGIGPGDEVIVPDFTFAASINSVLYCGATPVIVDVEPTTWTMDPAAVERALTDRTKALMPVHLYGHPCDMDSLSAIANAKGLLVVEDCAESLGSTYHGTPTGRFGDAAAFSFFGNKTITTGEGGLVLFRDGKAHDRAQQLRDHGMSPGRRYWHDVVGYNYRMTNLQAAIGVAQLERLDEILERKRTLARSYDELLAPLPGVLRPVEKAGCRSSYWLYTVLLEQASGLRRDEVQERLLNAGVETRPAFYPLHEMPIYAAFASGDFPHTTRASRQGLSLPSSVNLDGESARRVASALGSVLSVSAALRGAPGS